jgi:hypothetical protein
VGGCSAAYSKEYLGGMLDMWLSELKETIDKNKHKISAIEDEKVTDRNKNCKASTK